MKQKKKRAIPLVLAVALSITATACSSANQPSASEGGGQKNAPEALTPIEIVATTYAESPNNDLESLQELNKKFNVKLNVKFIPVNNYGDKLNVMLAANEIPDVTLVLDATKNNWASAISQGAFWDLTPFIKDYPNLAKYPEQIYNNLKVNGKIMGIPRVRPLPSSTTVIVRKDWMDKLGLQPPKTMDELYNIMLSFAKKDPDGNGKNDTPAVFVPGSGAMISFAGAGISSGVMGGYLLDSAGKLEPGFWSPQYREALVFWNKAYKEGLISQDFAILKPSQQIDFMVQGKSGLTFEQPANAQLWASKLKAANPQADLVSYELPIGLDGKLHNEQSLGSLGQLLISKKVSEDKLKKILQMFDYTATVDGNNLVTYGIKDKDYTITADGTLTQTEEGKKKGYAQGTTGQWIPGFYNMYLRADFPGAPEAVRTGYRKMIDHIMENSAPDPTYVLGTTPTATEKMTDWDKKLKDQVTNVIIGQQSPADWDKFVASYKSDPVFQKHLKELNEFYSAKSKK